MKKKTKTTVKYGLALGFLAGAIYLFVKDKKAKKMEQYSSVER